MRTRRRNHCTWVQSTLTYQQQKDAVDFYWKNMLPVSICCLFACFDYLVTLIQLISSKHRTLLTLFSSFPNQGFLRTSCISQWNTWFQKFSYRVLQRSAVRKHKGKNSRTSNSQPHNRASRTLFKNALQSRFLNTRAECLPVDSGRYLRLTQFIVNRPWCS